MEQAVIEDDFTDTDGDGLSDQLEIIRDLDKNNADTDGDGLTDFEEFMIYPTDPLLVDTFSFPVDQYSSDKEFIDAVLNDPSLVSNTYPFTDLGLYENLFRDRDGDGVSDVQETLYSMDPFDYDSDNDGFSDGFELIRGQDVRTPTIEQLQSKTKCRDCFLKIEGDLGSTIHLNLTNFKGNVPGSEIRYSFNKMNISILDNNNNAILSYGTNVTDIESVIALAKVLQGYNITNINAQTEFDAPDFKETIQGTNSKAVADINEGFVFVELDSPGRYTYQFKKRWQVEDVSLADKSFAQSFAVQRPSEVGNYRLLLDKPQNTYTYETFKRDWNNNPSFGYASLQEHVLHLNGEITYLRYGFDKQPFELRPDTTGSISLKYENGQYQVDAAQANQLRIISPLQKNFPAPPQPVLISMAETDKAFHPVYESQHSDNTAVIMLDDDNLMVNINVSGEQDFLAHFDDMLVYQAQGERFARWEHVRTPQVLGELHVGTIGLELDGDEVIMQDHNITFSSIDDDSIETATAELTLYNDNFDTPCFEYNKEYFASEQAIDNTLLAWLVSMLPLLFFLPLKRKSQMSAWLIVAVILALAFAIIFFVQFQTAFTFASQESQERLFEIKNEFNTYATTCHNDITACALYRLGANSGHLALQKGIATIPGSAKQMQDYVTAANAVCFEQYPDKETYRLTWKQGKTAITFAESDTVAKTKQRTILRLNRAKETINDYISTVPVRYQMLHRFMLDAIEPHRIGQEDIKIDLLAEQETVIRVYETDDKTVYQVIDPLSEVQPNLHYQYWFRQ